MSKHAVLLTLLLLICTDRMPQAEEVYQGTDDDGTPSFSDIPQANSQKLELKPLNVIPAADPLDIKLRFDSPQAVVKYTTLEVTSPEDDSTVFINTSNLPITVNVVPPVRNNLGHKLQILIDGSVLVENQTSYMLDDADRGTHNIVAKIVDEDGRAVATSPSITVHIQKPTAGQSPSSNN